MRKIATAEHSEIKKVLLIGAGLVITGKIYLEWKIVGDIADAGRCRCR